MKKIADFIGKHKLIVTCIAVLIIAVASFLLFGWIGLWYDAILAMIVGICSTGIKKHGLLKVLSILILLILLASYFLPGRKEVLDQIGIADTLINYFSVVLQNFSYIILFLLTIGGMYGVLNKIPSYKKLLDNIVTSAKPLNKKFIYITIMIFAIIASLTGMTIPLFIFVPLVASIILLLGYDKLVALSATIGSIVVGYIGGVFVNFINPNTYGITTFDELVGLDTKISTTFPKLLLLFSGIALLIFFVDRHIKNVDEKKVKYDLTDNSELLIAEVKGDYKDIKTWPLIVIFIFTFLILVLGMVPWASLFNINIFKDFHNWLIGLNIKDMAVIPTIISADLPALGEWTTAGNIMSSYVYMSMLLTFVTFIIIIINKLKFNEALDHYLEGVKKMIPMAALITVAYTVLVCAYNNGFLENMITSYGKFNYGICSLFAVLACLLNVDTIWVVVGAYTPMIELITDESVYSSVAVLLQGIFGIFQLIGPTSLILIIGLSYFDIPYTTWLKYIWRFILSLVILLALVTLLVIVL